MRAAMREQRVVVERLAWPHITHFRIKPRWTRYSDFLATPQPIIVELSFDNGR